MPRFASTFADTFRKSIGTYDDFRAVALSHYQQTRKRDFYSPVKYIGFL